ncbi:hypothetical protein [Pedobacter nutrimenti]|uniref:hypothetical protein n=1 Tax=Pedobacter nutrimenti TaxID=1241337 RepID=UPI002931A8C0|nr:hypothetical protein [Pedobacter nutrimenti]
MNNKKEGLFYFMHIPWTWAKQRPQFLAQELSQTFSVLIGYKKPFSKKNQSSETTGLNLLPIRMFPFNAKSATARFLNKIITKSKLRRIVSSCRYVWVTSPDLYDLLPDLKDDQILIYDCMDDMLSFSSIKDFPRTYNYYKSAERRLLSRSNVIICSSENLKEKLINRYDLKMDVLTINNGISGGLFMSSSASIKKTIIRRDDRKINIVYIGTIATWMDWELILKSLDVNSNILYHFVGPNESSIPVHDKILVYGPQAHKEITGIMEDADILFMPFQVTDLIRSVNPVKLYEYIYAGKPSISVRYEESEKFENFVYLYSDFEEYMELISLIQDNCFRSKRDSVESREFCYKNTWAIRGQQINDMLKKLHD